MGNSLAQLILSVLWGLAFSQERIAVFLCYTSPFNTFGVKMLEKKKGQASIRNLSSETTKLGKWKND